MDRLRRLFGGGSEPPHDHPDLEASAPGWDAINGAVDPLYPGQEPMHWGTIVRWRLGGPDPLDGVSAYRAEGPPTHWHYVGYGLSELYDKESDDPELSGWGLELTFRLRRAPTDTDPPIWPASFLQFLARYIFETGNVLAIGDHMDLNGPLVQDGPTTIRAVAFTIDPELPEIRTPNGAVCFVQVVGLTDDEYEATQDWDTTGILDLLRSSDPLLVTDLGRASILADPAVAETVRERTAVEGASMSGITIDRLALSTDGAALVVTMGASGFQRVRRLLVGRLPFGRSFFVRGEGLDLDVQPGDDLAWEAGDDGRFVLRLPDGAARRILDTVPAIAGTYEPDQRLRLVIERTSITDQSGREIGSVGDPSS